MIVKKGLIIKRKGIVVYKEIYVLEGTRIKKIIRGINGFKILIRLPLLEC